MTLGVPCLLFLGGLKLGAEWERSYLLDLLSTGAACCATTMTTEGIPRPDYYINL